MLNRTWQDVVNARKALSNVCYEYWYQHSLFSWQWWLLLIVNILVYTISWKLINKKRLFEIILVGSIIAIMSAILDLYGTQFMLWGYPIMVFPAAPPIFIDNYAVLPPVYCLIYQYCDKWKSYLIAIIILSLVFAFAVEPALVWMKMYDLHSWKYIYSFMIYIIMGIIVKGIVGKIKNIQEKVS